MSDKLLNDTSIARQMGQIRDAKEQNFEAS